MTTPATASSTHSEYTSGPVLGYGRMIFRPEFRLFSPYICAGRETSTFPASFLMHDQLHAHFTWQGIKPLFGFMGVIFIAMGLLWLLTSRFHKFVDRASKIENKYRRFLAFYKYPVSSLDVQKRSQLLGIVGVIVGITMLILYLVT